MQRQLLLGACLLAAFAIAGCGRIALQGVDYAADAANRFFVARLFFEFERFLIERLEQFLCALKENMPQFGVALVERMGHASPSIFW